MPGGDLRMRRDLVEVEHRLPARIPRRQATPPRRSRAGRKDLLHVLVHPPPVLALRELQIDEVGSPERGAQRRPELGLQRSNAVETSTLARIDSLARIPAGQPLVTPPDVLTGRARGEG